MNPPKVISAGKDAMKPFFAADAFTLFKKAQHEIQPNLALLDPAERTRYQRLLSPQKQLEFLTGRTWLKHVMADYLKVAPPAISLSLTATGKPYLPEPGSHGPFFNLSHADGHYLIGLSNHPIGVDLEPYRPVNLVRFQNFISSGEMGQLIGLPEPQRTRLFFRLFTVKEAFIKATDKKWALDTIQFQLVNGQWQLTAPDNPFQFTQIDDDGNCIMVCWHTSAKYVTPESVRNHQSLCSTKRRLS